MYPWNLLYIRVKFFLLDWILDNSVQYEVYSNNQICHGHILKGQINLKSTYVNHFYFFIVENYE